MKPAETILALRVWVAELRAKESSMKVRVRCVDAAERRMLTMALSTEELNYVTIVVGGK